MAFWNRKSTSVTPPAIYPNTPILEALGKLSANYIPIKTREAYARVFSTVSEVYSPIMYGAKCFSNMKIKLYTTNSFGEKKKEITSHPILQKLQEPNPLQNLQSFLELSYVNKKVFGNLYLFQYKPSGFSEIIDSEFWVLPSQYIYPVPVIRPFVAYYKSTKKDQFIKGYSFLLKYVIESTPNWKPEEILHIKEPNLLINELGSNLYVDMLEGRSVLSTLEEPITNIRKAYNAQNVILEKRGALGIISPSASKDAIGASTILNDKDKLAIQEQFKQYGLGEEQWQYIISNVSLSFQPMATPLKDLMLFEGIQNSMIAICNSLNFQITLLNYLMGATYSNVEELKKSFYQDNIIPEGHNFISELNNYLKLDEQKLILEADYSHIPCLQADAMKEAQKDKILIESINSILDKVKDGSLSIEGARAMLKIILEFSDEEINQILDKPINVVQNER